MNRTEEKDNLTSTHDLFKKERNHEQEIPAKCINFVLELLYPRCWMLYSGPGSHQRGSGSSMGSGSNGNYRNFRSTRSWPSDRTAICRSSVRQARTSHFHRNRKCFLCNLSDRPCLAFNAGTHGGYTIAYVCAIIGGIANSFWIPVFTRQYPKLFTKLRALLLWESNSSSQSHRCCFHLFLV